MAYTTIDKVKAMFRGIKIEADTGDEQTNTAVTIEDVNEFILEMDAYVDTRLADCYVVPITGAESLKVIGLISKYKVAHVIKTILEVNNSNSDKQQDVQTNLDVKAEKMLDRLCPVDKNGKKLDPIVKLVDAEMTLTSPISAAVFSRNLTGIRTPVIKKGGDNW